MTTYEYVIVTIVPLTRPQYEGYFDRPLTTHTIRMSDTVLMGLTACNSNMKELI